jgi:hypothetical protein
MTGSYKFWPWGSETEGFTLFLDFQCLVMDDLSHLTPQGPSVPLLQPRPIIDQIDQHTGENKKNRNRNSSRNWSGIGVGTRTGAGTGTGTRYR